MKRRRKTTDLAARLMCAMFALSLLMCATGCGKNNDEDWLTAGGGNATVVSSTDPSASGDAATPTTSVTSASTFEGEYPAPVFKTGKYRMVSSTIKQTEYVDNTGATVYSYTENSRYTYHLSITTGDILTCAYTFENVYISNSVTEDSGVLLDTSDPDAYKSDDTAGYFDLIGRTFTVTVDTNGNVIGLTGIDEIAAAYPSTAALLNTDDLQAMASDLFYALPTKFSAGAAWTLTQYESKNTYTVDRLSRGLFGIIVAGEQPELYSYSDDSNGTTVTINCTQISPLAGQLWIDQSDRAVQELSTYQRSLGTMTYSDYATSYSYTYAVSSTTTITAA